MHTIHSIGVDSIWKLHLTSIGIRIMHIRRSRDCVTFIMGIPVQVKRCLYWIDKLSIEQDKAGRLFDGKWSKGFCDN